MRRTCLGFVAVCALTAAFANVTSAAAQGTPEERRACGPDATRLCREFIPNMQAVEACLIRRQAELSEACRAVVVGPAVQPTQTVKREAAAPRKVKAKKKSREAERADEPSKRRSAVHEKREKKAKHADRKRGHGSKVAHERDRMMKHAHDKGRHKSKSSRTGKKSRSR